MGKREYCIITVTVGAKHLLILNSSAVLYSGQQMLRPYNSFPRSSVGMPYYDALRPVTTTSGFRLQT